MTDETRTVWVRAQTRLWHWVSRPGELCETEDEVTHACHYVEFRPTVKSWLSGERAGVRDDDMIDDSVMQELLQLKEALEELIENAGTQYDVPQVVPIKVVSVAALKKLVRS